MEEKKFDKVEVTEQQKKIYGMNDRQEQLGFYGQFSHASQYKITPLAFSVLQREVGNEIILFSKNHYKPNNVIKFKDDIERNQFQIASKYFEGKKFKDFLGFSEELSIKNFDEYWQSVANEEKPSIEEHLGEILNRTSICGQRIDGLNHNHLPSMILSKVLKYDIKSLENEIADLADAYVGICDLYKTWLIMSKNERKQYVAKRYLSTGSLDFDCDVADKYCIDSIRNKEILCKEENNMEFQQ